MDNKQLKEIVEENKNLHIENRQLRAENKVLRIRQKEIDSMMSEIRKPKNKDVHIEDFLNTDTRFLYIGGHRLSKDDLNKVINFIKSTRAFRE